MIFRSRVVAEAASELARVRAVKADLAQLRRGLNEGAVNSSSSITPAKVFYRLCDAYESIAVQSDCSSHDTSTSSSRDDANLCASIDELLDQLACVNPSSRFWKVKAALAFDPVETLARRREKQLEVVLQDHSQAQLRLTNRFRFDLTALAAPAFT